METNTTATTTETTATEAPTETQTQEQTPPSLKERFKLQVDGAEIEEEVDWNDKETLKKKLQLAAAAKKRMGEASTIKSQAIALMKAWESGDVEILKKHPKGRAIAEAFLAKELEEEGLTQEQKDQRARDQKLKKYEDRDKEDEAKKQTEAQAAQERKLAEGYQKTIIDAIEKTGLPKSPELVKRMAGLLLKNNRLGLELTAEDLAAEVKTETTGLLKTILKHATGAQLIEMFGPDIAKQIRKHDLEALKQKQTNIYDKKTTPPKTETPAKGYKTVDEWKEELEKRVKS